MLTLVADDHELVREGLVMMLGLSQDPGPFDVKEASNYRDAMSLARRHPFELAIVDLYMPGGDGLPSLEALCDAMPNARVLVLSGSEDPRDVADVLDAGLAGYVPKAVSSRVLLQAVRTVIEGGIYDPANVRGGAPRPAVPSAGQTVSLTGRQMDVLKMMAAGHSNKEIAGELGLSPATVKTHVSAILAATGAANRAEAAAQAKRLERLARLRQ